MRQTRLALVVAAVLVIVVWATWPSSAEQEACVQRHLDLGWTQEEASVPCHSSNDDWLVRRAVAALLRLAAQVR